MNIITIQFDELGVATITIPEPVKQGNNLVDKLVCSFAPTTPTIASVRLHARKPNGDITNALIFFVKVGDVWEYTIPSWFTEFAGTLQLSVSVQFQGIVDGWDGDIITRNSFFDLESIETKHEANLYV
ncbi:MAG: hypothetical protein EOM74_02380, partial [Methanomicrobia archaeon]|nr:hypothetical protein [Methanomicrobia archaeon]